MKSLIWCRCRGPAILSLALILLAGCASRGGPIPYGSQALSAPDPQGPVIAFESNTLVPGDKLLVNVYQVKDLTGEYTVDLSGTIAVPLIGKVLATGRTPDQLAAVVAERLGERYLRNPTVTVNVMESTGRLVTVDGAVRQPGLYPVNTKLTLISAVALARGTSEDANPRRAAIFRRIRGQRMAAAFDLTSIRQGEMEDPEVFAGDVVVVQGSRTNETIRYILSAVGTLSLFTPYISNAR